MFIVLLGAPGSGKGTVGKILSQELGLVQISTGDLFRENLKNETELGKQAKIYMDKGELVPDDITINMLVEKMQEYMDKGVILDGFPRTEKQAIELDDILLKSNKKVNMALNIEVPFEEIVKRISNRRTCSNCGEIYNITYKPPRIADICDKCGCTLYQREDQKEEIVKNRLDVYKKSSAQLIDYYKESNVLYSAKAGDKVNKNSEDVAKEVITYIKERKIS